MSDVTRAPLSPIGSKSGTINARDARIYARDLVDAALFGPGAYHPDGGYMDQDDRMRRLGEAVALLYKLKNRVTNVDGWNSVKKKIDEIDVIRDSIWSRLLYNQFDAPYKKEPIVFIEELPSPKIRRIPVLPR